MILTCPECETQYFAEDSTIGDSGRTVKCATCGHSWFVGSDGHQIGSRAAGAHEMYRLKVRERRQKQSRQVVFSVWATVMALFVLTVSGLYLLRTDVVERWPETATSYAMLGLEVNRFGLDFVETRADRFFDGTTPILEVRGHLRNIRRSQIDAPQIRVDMLDETGIIIATSYADIAPPEIAAGDLAAFAARIENPPYESFELDISLIAPNPQPNNSERGVQ